MSGKPTLYGLLALSAMELVASQKPGSPLAILQQPTKGFDASAIALTPQNASPQAEVIAPPSLAAQAIPISDQAPHFTEPALSPIQTDESHQISQPIVASKTTKVVFFRDLQSHWSQPFVELLAARGIISGYADGTFQPDGDIQAAHFGIMLRQAKLYRLETLQRELDMIQTPNVHQPSSAPIYRYTKSSTIASVTEAEATELLRTHDIRTRAQAAVFIYRNFQASVVSQTSASESLAVQPAQVSYDPPKAEPTFSDTEDSSKAPMLSATFQWSPIDPTWVAQG